MVVEDLLADQPNTVRDEGNAFHWLLEKPRPFAQYVDTKAKNGVLYTEEMAEHAETYFDTISNYDCDWSAPEHPTTWVYSNIVEVRGRADFIAYDSVSRALYVIDAKYGYTLVEPEDNYTLISHAIGWMNEQPDHPVNTVIFSIYQPRGFHPEGVWRHHDVTAKDIATYKAAIIMQAERPSALTVSNRCGGCRAAHCCPALRQSVGVMLDMMSGTYTDDLTPDQISQQMQLVDKASAIVKARLDALSNLTVHTLESGHIVEGYLLEKNYANRSWNEQFSAEDIAATFGIDAYKKTIISPAQAEKLGADGDIVKAMTERKYVGQKLVRRTADKAAKKAFGKGKK